MTDQVIANQILRKIQHYCAYQERCSFEVKIKLKELKTPTHLVKEIIEDLIKDNYINDERYCKMFAMGKFKHNKWGKHKITMALKQKMLSDDFIEKGLAEIPETDYLNLVCRLYQSKVKDKNPLMEEKAKAIYYLQSKGFEKGVIAEAIKAVEKLE